MGWLKKLTENAGEIKILQDRGHLPRMTDEDYVLPSVEIDEAMTAGKKEIGKVAALGASILAFGTAVTLFVMSEVNTNKSETPRIPIPTPNQCPAPGTHRV